MRILALDPSLNCFGWAVLDYNESDESFYLVDKGVIHNKIIPAKLPGKKLHRIRKKLQDICSKYEFQAVVREASFVTKRIKSSERTFMVIGIVVETLHECGYSDIQEVSATTVKKVVGGDGKCSKEEVRANLDYFVGRQEYETEDESDAVAVGITYVSKINTEK